MTRKETFDKCECIFSHDKVLLTKVLDKIIEISNKKSEDYFKKHDTVKDGEVNYSLITLGYKDLKEKIENTKTCDNLTEELEYAKKIKF